MVERDFVDIDDIMATLDKETLSKVRLASEISKDYLPTASFGINRALGGGLRIGKQHTFWGGEGSAKSALLMQTVAINQRLGVPCLWIDAEHIFDPDWAAKLGVDTTKLPIIEASTVEEISNLQFKWIDKGIRLIVIDSTSALMPTSFVDKDGEIKDFGDTNQQGTVAKDLGKMCKMVQGINYSCAIVHISQVRVDLGAQGMTKPFKPVGGKEVGHTDAFRVRLAGTKATDKQIKDTVQHGEMAFEEEVGYPVSYFVNKNRINGDLPTGEFNFFKKGEFIGIDYAGELLDEGKKYGIVEGTTWLTIYGERFQGKKNAVKYLRANPEIQEKLEAEINAKSL